MEQFLLSEHVLYTMVLWALYAVFSTTLLWGATIDSFCFILPNKGVLILLLGGICYMGVIHKSIVDVILQVSVVGTCTMGLRYISRKGLGLGDVKWWMAIAVWLTSTELIVQTVLAFLLGTFFIVIAKLFGCRFQLIPFGPFLAMSSLISFYYGNDIYRVYMAMFGL